VTTQAYLYKPGDLLKVPQAEITPADIARMWADLEAFMPRSIGTTAGIAKARIRQQAQQLRESHDRRS
jgi:hypothetical protein